MHLHNPRPASGLAYTRGMTCATRVSDIVSVSIHMGRECHLARSGGSPVRVERTVMYMIVLAFFRVHVVKTVPVGSAWVQIRDVSV